MPAVISPPRGPAGSGVLVADTIKFISVGPVTPAAALGSSYRFYNDTDIPLNITSVRANLGTAGTTTTTVDVLKNGTSIYASATANRPTLASGVTSALQGGAPSTTVVAPGEYLDFGTTTQGTSAAGLVITVGLSG